MGQDVQVILLYVGAVVAEVTGLALAAHGFRRTWLEFRDPQDQFIAPMITPITAKVRVAYVRVRTLVGRPISPKTLSVGGASMIVAAGSARVTVTWAPLPSVSDDPAAFMETLDRRLSELNNRVQDAEERRHADARASVAQHAEATRAIDQVRQEARGQVRTITVGGLREQVVGWLLIVAGVLAAGIGDIISAA